MNMFKTILFLSVMTLCLFPSTLSAQTSVRIDSKAICTSNVEVTWFNPGVFPNTQSTIVSVPALSVVNASCPSCIGSGWVLCAFEVSFTDGSGIIFPEGISCFFTPIYNGPFHCFSSGSAFYGSGVFSYYY